MNAQDFGKLYKLDCSEHIEKKDVGNGRKLSYLSWAWAWAEFKNVYPNATYEVVKFDGLPYIIDAMLGIIVYTRVTVDGLTHEMWLPVMDASNKAMKLESYQYSVWNYQKKAYEQKTVKAADMFDINKTIMRCLVKNLAMFGLGLSIYAGEDVPQPLSSEEEEALAQDYQREHQGAAAAAAPAAAPAADQPKPKRTSTRSAGKKTELPPTEAPQQQAAPAEQKTLAHVALSNTDLTSRIIDWIMRQPDTNAAIQRASIGYDWEQDALDYVVKSVKERFAFINDLHGNQ